MTGPRAQTDPAAYSSAASVRSRLRARLRGGMTTEASGAVGELMATSAGGRARAPTAGGVAP